MNNDPKQTTLEWFCILHAKKCSHHKVTKWMSLRLNRGRKLNCDKSKLFKGSLVRVYQIILNIMCWTKALILILLSNRNILRNKPTLSCRKDLWIVFCFYEGCNCPPNLWATPNFLSSWTFCSIMFSLMPEATLGCLQKIKWWTKWNGQKPRYLVRPNPWNIPLAWLFVRQPGRHCKSWCHGGTLHVVSWQSHKAVLVIIFLVGVKEHHHQLQQKRQDSWVSCLFISGLSSVS